MTLTANQLFMSSSGSNLHVLEEYIGPQSVHVCCSSAEGSGHEVWAWYVPVVHKQLLQDLQLEASSQAEGLSIA